MKSESTNPESSGRTRIDRWEFSVSDEQSTSLPTSEIRKSCCRLSILWLMSHIPERVNDIYAAPVWRMGWYLFLLLLAVPLGVILSIQNWWRLRRTAALITGH
jgi:hypothetical protein